MEEFLTSLLLYSVLKFAGNRILTGNSGSIVKLLKVTIPSLIFLLVFQPVSAGHFSHIVGAKSAALGGQTAAVSDIFSANNNQAGLGFLKDFSFGVTGHKQYVLPGMDFAGAAGLFPTKTGNFGIMLNYYGRKEYNEKKAGLSYSRSFLGKFSFGVQFDYLNMAIEGYGSKNLFTFEVGLQYFVFKQLMLGAHVFNPIRIKIEGEQDERLATVMQFGLHYIPSKKISILFETEKDLEFKPLFKLGIDYRAIDKLSIRGGFNAKPYTGSFGLALHLKNLDIDAAAVVHPVLGVTPHLSLSYVFKKKQ